MRRLVEDQILHLVLVRDVALGLRGLPLQRREAARDLRDDVADAQQVLPRLIHLLLGLLLPGLVLGDAGGLFDQHPAIFGARRDDEPDLSLLDDRVRLGADAGAEEQIGDVLEADLGLVDQVLARAVAEEAARDGDLGVVAVFDRQPCVGIAVLEGHRDLGHAVRAAVLGAVEDDVLHRAAAEVLRALLAHAPSNRVDDVGFAAAVRADDAHDVGVEVDDRAVHERLEAADFELTDAHRAPRGFRHVVSRTVTPRHLGLAAQWTRSKGLRLYRIRLPRDRKDPRAQGCSERAPSVEMLCVPACLALALTGGQVGHTHPTPEEYPDAHVRVCLFFLQE